MQEMRCSCATSPAPCALCANPPTLVLGRRYLAAQRRQLCIHCRLIHRLVGSC